MNNTYQLKMLVQLNSLEIVGLSQTTYGLAVSLEIGWSETPQLEVGGLEKSRDLWFLDEETVNNHTPFLMRFEDTWKVFSDCWFEATLKVELDECARPIMDELDIQSLKLLCGPCDTEDAVDLYHLMKVERDSANGQPGITAFFEGSTNGR